VERDSKARDAVLDCDQPSAWVNGQADETVSARRDLLLDRAVAIAVRGGEARKIPKAGPAFAGLAVPEHNTIAAPNDDGDFGHVFVHRPFRRLRDFGNLVLLPCLT